MRLFLFRRIFFLTTVYRCFSIKSQDYIFRKGGVANTLFRKGLNTFGTVGREFNVASNIASRVSPVLSTIDPRLGGIVGEAGVLGKSLRNTINYLVSS
jgi:hypothetical protein